MKFRVTDKDQGDNANLHFWLSPDASTMFMVDEDGALESRTPLDREIRAQYTFIVMVRDSGTPAFTSTATVNLIVQVRYAFRSSIFFFAVLENSYQSNRENSYEKKKSLSKLISS